MDTATKLEAITNDRYFIQSLIDEMDTCPIGVETNKEFLSIMESGSAADVVAFFCGIEPAGLLDLFYAIATQPDPTIPTAKYQLVNDDEEREEEDADI